MTAQSWRDRARPVVAATLAALPPDATTQDKRRALRDAYPFGERAMWPYKVWCDEVRRQLGLERPRRRRDRAARTGPSPADLGIPTLGEQGELFSSDAVGEDALRRRAVTPPR